MSCEYVKSKVKALRDCFPQGAHGDLTTDAGKGQIACNDKITYLGAFLPSSQFRNASETKIEPSPYHNVLPWPPVTSPSPLKCFTNSNGDFVNPMRIAIEKQFVPGKTFDPEILQMASDDFQDTILSAESRYKEMPDKILTEHQNINGVDGHPYLAGINLNTSAGYPYTKSPMAFTDPKGHKYPFVTLIEDDKYELKPEMREIIAEKEEAMRNGIVPPFICTDNTKDERLPTEKVEKGKVRVFNCLPMDLVYLTRKYFLNFIAHCMENNTGEVSVGIDAHSYDWTVLHRRITKFGKNRIIAGDYSAYDKRLPFDIIMKVLDIIQAYYNDEHYMIRRCIFIATFNAIHLNGCDLYRCFRGNPSGTPLTTNINCCVNSILFRYAYMFMSVEYKMDPFTFRKFVEFAAYGDDNLSGVSEMVPWFNAKSYANVMKLHGIDYTSCSKGKIEVEYEHIDDVSYLKRRFVEREGWVYAPLEKNSIHETMQWCRPSSNTMLSNMQSTFDSFCQEMVHYGKVEYNEYVDIIMKASYELSTPLALRRNDYHTLLAAMRNKSY
jgi:hypothetical protein